MGQKSGSNLRPWFQFYATDFIAGTVAFTDETVGCYLRVLCYQWTNGDVPIDDDEAMAMIAKSWPKHAAKLASKFPNGANPRLESIRDGMLEQAEKNVERSRKAAMTRWHGDQSGSGSGDLQNDDALSNAPSNAQSNARSNALSNARTMPLTPTPTLKQISKPKSKSTDQNSDPITPQMWEAFKAIYPDRQGTQGMAKALKKATALIRSGVPWSDIMGGARRYRDQQQAAGKIGTEFVKRAEYFLSADAKLWEEPYPVTSSTERTSKNAAQIRKFIDAG